MSGDGGDTAIGKFWKSVLAQLACVVCKRHVPTGVRPSLHHFAEGSGHRSVFALVPLCEPHHQGPRGLHGAGAKAFCETYRPPGDREHGLLIWVIEDVAEWLRFKLRSPWRRP